MRDLQKLFEFFYNMNYMRHFRGKNFKQLRNSAKLIKIRKYNTLWTEKFFS